MYFYIFCVEFVVFFSSDLFNFKCEPDEYFLLVNEMKKDNLIRTNWNFLKSQKNSFSGKDFLKWVVEKKGLGNNNNNKNDNK